MISDSDLAAMKARCEAATPGPWEAQYNDYGDEIWYGGEGAGMWSIHGPAGCYMAGCCDGGEEARARAEADAKLLARAREDLPRCIAEIERLRALILCFYDPDPCSFDHHGGCQAHGFLECEGKCPMAEVRELAKGESRD